MSLPDSITLRATVKTIFTDIGVSVDPLSFLLVPITHCSTIHRTTIKCRSGSSYDAFVFVIPADRIGQSIKQSPYSETKWCLPPPSRTTAILPEDYKTIYDRDNPWKTLTYPLLYTQLQELKKQFGPRPRKAAFDEAMDKMKFEGDKDASRKQFLLYRNGPLDDVELEFIYEQQCGASYTKDEVIEFFPEGVNASKAYIQWIAANL